VLDDVTDYEGTGCDGLWATFHRGLGRTIQVRVTNTSDAVWEPSPVYGLHAVNLGYQWLDADTKKMVFEGGRYPLGAQVPPGASREIEMLLNYPGPGRYILHVSLIQEGHAWFYHECDQYSLDITID
jgi:hypothetical protein